MDIGFTEKIKKLNDELYIRGVDRSWLDTNMNNEKFRIYFEMDKRFKNSPERKVRNNIKDFAWYKKVFDLDKKILNAAKFMLKNKSKLLRVEEKSGIHHELITAIIGMETNYANKSQRGNFYAFNALVTQYLLMHGREYFAVRELASLYYISEKINKDVFYFIGSYAGACGWAQFIPSSLNNFFIDYNNNDDDLDIYSIEDCIASIENYFYNHGLNSSNIEDYQSRYNAVYKYNRSDAYAKAVLYIYDELRRKKICRR